MPKTEERVPASADHWFFLGGRDLEMIEVAALLREADLVHRIVDKGLAWGAAASAYLPEIRTTLAAGHTPVLVELAYDLPDEIDRSAVIEIDHHGARAGIERPSSLRQIFDQLIADGATIAWTRRRALVEANDVGHARGMRALGASADEIRKIRDDDRAAQGVTSDIEVMSKRAIAESRWERGLLVIVTEASTASAIMDYLLPEYDGPVQEEAETIVIMPQSVAFFGRGSIIDNLKAIPECWYGGALPEVGFWGAPRRCIGDVETFCRQLATMVDGTKMGCG